jgi:hypothetical protein
VGSSLLMTLIFINHGIAYTRVGVIRFIVYVFGDLYCLRVQFGNHDPMTAQSKLYHYDLGM